tara:strand:+ start:357 stop:656 length:300 start_codon:yes stop_codon:yes gene_type:complete
LPHKSPSSPDAKISIRLTHSGLAGRQLTASSLNRLMSSAETSEDQSQSELVTTLGDVRPRLTDIVRQFTEPLFMLFDFKQIAPEVYEDIVQRFVKGEVS